MIKLIRGWRVLRVGRGRVLRILLVAVLFVLAWRIFLLRHGPDFSLRSLAGSVTTRSPIVHGPAPIIDPHSSAKPLIHNVVLPTQKHLTPEAKREHIQWVEREEVLQSSNNINPRYNIKAMKDKFQDLPVKPVRNQLFLQQQQLSIMGLYKDEDDENEYGIDLEGKWNGRNKDDNAEDVAVEEEDDSGDQDDDDFALDDVGGEKLKKGNDAMHSEEKKKEKKLTIDKKRYFALNKDYIGDRNMDAEHKVNAVKELKDKFMEFVGKDDLQDIEQELNLRKSRIREVCNKYGLGHYASAKTKPVVKHPPTPNYDVFYIDRHDELAWCPIYKAASTSWLHNFLILGGVKEKDIANTKEQVSSIARKVWPSLDYDDAEKAFRTCLKFMIVRHPFERLVSAYRDKLENTNIGKEHGVEHFYKKYGKKIVDKYRPSGQGLPALRYSQDMDDPSIPPPKGIEPTFGEFVKYIIATDLAYYADDHWMPYYLYCTPCLLDYDVIAKFETLDRDQTYIIKKKHLGKKIKPSWKHLTKGIKTADTVRKYFATITKKDLMNLYEKYKLDFELFDYSVDEYLSFVRDAE